MIHMIYMRQTRTNKILEICAKFEKNTFVSTVFTFESITNAINNTVINTNNTNNNNNITNNENLSIIIIIAIKSKMQFE